jgi:signal transduction histidine kinase
LGDWVRALLLVPMFAHDALIGSISIVHSEPGFFTDEHIRIAQSVAGQAAAAVENARLFEQVQLRTRETEALLRSDEELFRSLDIDDVFQALADVAVDLLGADKSVFWTWDAVAGSMKTRASRNFSAASVSTMQSAATYMVPAGRPERVIVEEDTTENVESPWREILDAEGIVRWAEVTLVVPDGPVLGSFAAGYTTNHVLTENERRVFVALGERAAMAISNAELHGSARQVTALEERQRLARELHDSVSQALYGIALGARTARTLADRDPAKVGEPLDYVLSLAEAGLAEMRALIFELRPESLETEGLVAALEKQIAMTSARYNIAVAADLGAEPEVPIEMKECLYRIGQEALHNMVKHAEATEVTVKLRSEGGAVELTVTDNGKGFDPAGDFAGHLGLRSMRERCAAVGGEVAIESSEGHGTTVRARLNRASD